MTEQVAGMGELSKATGIKSSMLRYLFESGALPEPALRSPQGGRLFFRDDLDRIQEALKQRK